MFRFLGGVFAAASLSNSGCVAHLYTNDLSLNIHRALIADIWDIDTRGKALAIYSLAPFAGPSLGPTVGGYMQVAGVPWRWTFWLLTFFAGACFIAVYFTIPETYA